MSTYRDAVTVHRLAIGLAALILLLVGLPSLAQQKAPPPPNERPLDDRIARYERTERIDWQKPDEIIKALNLRHGAVVADIGAGSGYFTRRFAKAVAAGGKVYAVDIDQDILGFLKGAARKENLNNIEIIVSKEDDPVLPENSVDLVFFCDTTHHLTNRVAYYRTLSRALKPDARIAIVDFPPEANEKGHCPHEPDELVPRWQVIQEAEQAGFKLVEEFSFLPRQYFLIFKKR